MARRPDGLEAGLRIGCGALFGLALLGPLLTRFAFRWRAPLLWQLGLPAVVVLFALLAYRWGDGLYDRWRDGELAGSERAWLWIVLAGILFVVVVISVEVAQQRR